jgi:hypothetical protein
MTKIFSLVDINKKESTKSKTVTKLEGLKRRYKNRTSIDYVLQIEKLWERYALELDTAKKERHLETILKMLSLTIKGKARATGARWNNSRLSAADFESIYFEEAWKLCDNYSHYGEFYFYETLLLVLKRRGIDLIRKQTTTHQGAFELKVRRLKEEAADYLPDAQVDVEGSALNSILVTRMLTVSSLTKQERELLRVKFHNPDLSKVELARAIGLKHHQEVTRLFKRLKIKLAAFNDKN